MHRRTILFGLLSIILAACGDDEKTNQPSGNPPNPCATVECAHGACKVVDGAAQCECEPGYAGERCDVCAAGYQDNDDDGTCLPGCAMTDCDDGYECNDASGTAQCIAVPPGPVAQLRWSDVGAITLHWIPPNTAWQEVRVVRSTSGFPTDPTDGDVVFEGRARRFVDTSAQPGTTYYYAVWTVANGVYSPQPASVEITGNWKTTSFTASGTFTSSATFPYMTVYAWGAGGGEGLQSSSSVFRGGNGGGGGGYAIFDDGVVNYTVAATGTSAAMSDHLFYPAALGPGSGGGANQDGRPGYVVVVESRCGPEWGGPTCTDDVAPPMPVTDLTLDPDLNRVTWTPSSSPDAVGILIRRSPSGHPQTPDDGQLVADLPASTSLFDLPDDGNYSYSVFVYDAAGNVSAPAHVPN